LWGQFEKGRRLATDKKSLPLQSSMLLHTYYYYYYYYHPTTVAHLITSFESGLCVCVSAVFINGG
jgi:hypothetical protein